MGEDKLWMALDGMPLIERTVRRVLPLAAEVLFASRGEASPPKRNEGGDPAWDGTAAATTHLPGNASPLHRLAEALSKEGVPARVVTDLFPGAGPLAGLHAGLSAATCDLLLALAADMPFVKRALIEEMMRLAEGFDAVVPLVPGPGRGPAWEPLHALYRQSCLPAITARLAAGEHRANSFLPDVRVRPVTADEIAAHDPEMRSLFNINTPEEWQAALRLA